MAYTGQLYQLISTRELPVGSRVEVNGPYDTYGIVIRSEPHPDGYLNLIRGVQKRDSEPVVYRW